MRRSPQQTLCFDIKSYGEQSCVDFEISVTFQKIKAALSGLDLVCLIEPLTRVEKGGQLFFRRRIHVQRLNDDVDYNQVKERVNTIMCPYFWFVDFEIKKEVIGVG